MEKIEQLSEVESVMNVK